MNKSLKVLIGFMIVFIGLLSITSGYFYARVLSLQSGGTKATTASTDTAKKIESSLKEESTSTAETQPITTSPAATASSSVSEPAPLGDRPSSPSDTVKVEPGETMFAIGKRVGITWTEIVAANGLTDANKIKAGQILIVPKNNQVSYTINKTKAQELQASADKGKIAFRLSSLDTAKSDCSPVYGLTTTDSFKVAKTDPSSGIATVTATKNSKIYQIDLVQPATKGEKGIWAIESIKTVTD